MKKMILLFCFIFPALAYAQPSIDFEKVQFDFGEVETGGQLEYDFVFTNMGAEELVIEKIVPS